MSILLIKSVLFIVSFIYMTSYFIGTIISELKKKFTENIR